MLTLRANPPGNLSDVAHGNSVDHQGSATSIQHLRWPGESKDQDGDNCPDLWASSFTQAPQPKANPKRNPTYTPKSQVLELI